MTRQRAGDGPLLLEKLVEFVATVRMGDVPGIVRRSVKERVLDHLGVALAGADAPESVAVRSWASAGTPGPCSVYGGAARVGWREAAFANGVAGNVLELDDTHDGSFLHPGTVVIPAALAAGEYLGSGWEEVFAAVLAGYEVAVRVSLAARSHRAQGFGPTGTCGTLGAAAAAARLLGLSCRGWLSALGIAGTLAPVSLQQFLFEDSSVKVLYAGHAAATGVAAAFMGERGLTGPASVLEGEHGFLNTMSRWQWDPTALSQALGRRYSIAEVSTKFYPCCRHFHAGLDCALDLKRTHAFAPGDVEAVTVHTYPLAIRGHDGAVPVSRPAAQQSYPHMLAVALCHGEVKLGALEPEGLATEEVREVAARVRLVPVEEWAGGPMRAQVAVSLRGGQVLEQEQTSPIGSPECPLTPEQREAKFLDLVSGTGASGPAILRAFQSLDGATRVNVRQLLATGLDTVPDKEGVES